MTPENVPSKADLRRELRRRLRELPVELREKGSSCACNLLRLQSVWTQSESVLLYVPFHIEIDVGPLISEALASGKVVALPRFVEESGVYEARQISHATRDCSPGKFGIPEPGNHCAVFPLNRLDLVVVPGLGFDRFGHRLGRGRGFYDRILAQVSGIKCGIAFDEQLLDHVPAESHDVCLNCVVTPTRWLPIAQ